MLIGGAVLVVLSAFYIAASSIPNTPSTALLFPLSILGVLFGIGAMIWSISWILLEKFNLLK